MTLSLLWAAWLSSAGSGRWTGCDASMEDVQICEQTGTMCEEAVGMCERAFGMCEEVVWMFEGMNAGWGGL